MMKMIVAESDEDSSESHSIQSVETKANTTMTSPLGRKIPDKMKKFVVTLKKPTKTSFVLPKRGRKDHVPKFQIQHNTHRGNTFSVSTKRPKLMQAKKFTSKPHAIDYAQELIVRNNFNKKLVQSKFNQYDSEEKQQNTEKHNYNNQNSVNIDIRFQNFTDIDISSENDSDESDEIKKPLYRRYMKTAASDKVKAIASPPPVSVNTQKNYRIKDLLKIQKYNPRIDRKLVPALSLQKGDNVIVSSQNDTASSKNVEIPSAKKIEVSSEESADQNEFIFVQEDKHKSSTTASPEDDEVVTIDPIILI